MLNDETVQSTTYLDATMSQFKDGHWELAHKSKGVSKHATRMEAYDRLMDIRDGFAGGSEGEGCLMCSG